MESGVAGKGAKWKYFSLYHLKNERMLDPLLKMVLALRFPKTIFKLSKSCSWMDFLRSKPLGQLSSEDEKIIYHFSRACLTALSSTSSWDMLTPKLITSLKAPRRVLAEGRNVCLWADSEGRAVRIGTGKTGTGMIGFLSFWRMFAIPFLSQGNLNFRVGPIPNELSPIMARRFAFSEGSKSPTWELFLKSLDSKSGHSEIDPS